MISKTLLQPILNWPRDTKIPICVACDVGGTGTNVRISSFYDETKFIDLPKFNAQRSSDLINGLKSISKTLHEVVPNSFCRGSALSVAGPISENTVVLPNWPGQYSHRTITLTELPTDLFPAARSKFLNDTEATAYGILAVNSKYQLDEYFEKLFPENSPAGGPVNDRRTAIIYVGAGLGCSLVVKTPLFKRKIVVPTELGHLELPIVGHKHPDYKFEKDLVQYISNQHYDGELAIELEDIVSGKGLCNVYQYFMDKTSGKKVPLSELDGGEIAKLAAKKDPVAYKSLVLFNQMAIRSAKTISTTMNCDSVILTSNNQVANHYIIKENYEKLKNEFYSFIRPDWMKTITIFTQTKNMNFSLFGTSSIAHNLGKNEK